MEEIALISEIRNVLKQTLKDIEAQQVSTRWMLLLAPIKASRLLVWSAHPNRLLSNKKSRSQL